MDTLENICQGGSMNGHTFNIDINDEEIELTDAQVEHAKEAMWDNATASR